MLQLKAILIIRSQRQERQGAQQPFHKLISMNFQDFHIYIYVYIFGSQRVSTSAVWRLHLLYGYLDPKATFSCQTPTFDPEP